MCTREFRQKTSPSLLNLKSPGDSRRGSSLRVATPTTPGPQELSTPPSGSSLSPKSYFSSPDYNSNNRSNMQAMFDDVRSGAF